MIRPVPNSLPPHPTPPREIQVQEKVPVLDFGLCWGDGWVVKKPGQKPQGRADMGVRVGLPMLFLP